MLVETHGAGEFRQLGKRFRQAANGKTVRTALTKRIKAVADDAKRDVQAGYRAMKITAIGKRHGHPPPAHEHALRAGIAKQVKISVRYAGKGAGVRLYVDAAKLPEGQQPIPDHIERRKGWRHPTYGRRDRWVSQHASPVFEPTTRKYTVKVRAGVVQAVDEALRELQ